jgi:hypothetical protein
MSQNITVLGYQFNTEQEAKDAVNALNVYYGIPVTPDAVTQTWCNYGYNGVYWYIVWDDSMNIVLGEPTEINIV